MNYKYGSRKGWPGDETIRHMGEKVVIVCSGVGDPALKKRFVEKTREAGFQLAKALIHPNIKVSTRNRIGEGAYIGIGASIREKISIGAEAVIGGGAFVRDKYS